MKKFIFNLLTAIILVGVGIFMIAMPEAFLGTLVIVFASLLVLDAIKSLYMVFAIKAKSRNLKITMAVKAVINAAIGIVAIVMAARNPSTVSKVIVYLIAIDFFATALVDISDYIVLKHIGFPTGTMFTEIVMSILFGVLFCIFPQVISDLAIIVLAVVLIAIGVIILISGVYNLYIERTLKKYGIKKGSDPTETDFTHVE